MIDEAYEYRAPIRNVRRANAIFENAETIASGLVSFYVEVFSGDRWSKAYPPTGKLMHDAKAIRISLHWSDGNRATIRTFLVPDVK